VKVLALALGKPMQYHAPTAQAGYLAPLQTTVVQLPDGSYGMPGSPFPGYGAGTFPPQGPFGQIPSAPQQGNPQNGRGQLSESTKRAAVEMHLSRLTPAQLGVATGSSIVVALAAQGVPLDETYAGRILGEWRVSHKATTGTTVRRKK
jgi:hypothetical protein